MKARQGRASDNKDLQQAHISTCRGNKYVPVGPRKRKDEPRLREARPARDRSTASATALTASSWPTTRLR